MEDILFQASEIVTPFEAIPDGLVWVNEDGQIEWTGTENSLPEAARGLPRKEYPGERLLPGLIDIHLHGGFGIYFGEGDLREGVHTYSKKIPFSGVTGFLLSIAAPTADELVAIIKEYVNIFETNSFEGSQPLGLHLEGPFLNPEKKGAFNPHWLRVPNIAEAKSYIEAGKGWIKQITIAPELPNAFEVARYLRQNGVKAAMGHTNATYEQASAALQQDFRHVTHTFNAQRGFNQREPGVFGAVMDSDEIHAELICDTIHVHPGAIKMAARCLKPEQIVLITDAIGGAHLPDGIYESLGQKILIKNGLVLLETGTIAGSTVALNHALKNAARYMEYNFHQVVRMATYNPAKVIGLENNRGSITAGKRADLIAIDCDGSVTMNCIRGQIIYTKESA
ncbi:MAG: N-acetylglucosamine-6-phosphate deacetylase [Anaerolineaceae bacterium]|nr:N-acetylglucosamine-6-phosphate deacetylase [Anaerolineaceae bacterium]